MVMVKQHEDMRQCGEAGGGGDGSLHTHLRQGQWSPGVPPLAKEVRGRKLPTPLPSQKLLFTLLGEWCLPCQRLPDVVQTSAGGCRM